MTDRFSSVPLDVAHRIVSFLDIEDLTRLGCVSKKCNQIYLTSPWLDFNFGYGCDFTSTCEKRIRLFNSLDRFLFVRRGDNKIQRFHVRWFTHRGGTGCYCRDELFRVFSWVECAVKCNVEELHLETATFGDNESENSPIVPSSLLLSGSLRTRVKFCEAFPPILRTPANCLSSNIEWLELAFVNLDEGFFDWISSSCKCIKHLNIMPSNHIQNVTFQSSSLESFEYDCSGGYCSAHLAKTNLNICSPNLKRVKLFGCSLVRQNLHALTSLEHFSYMTSKADEYKIVYEVLRSVCSVQHLELHCSVISVLLKGRLMPAFPDVRYFMLSDDCFADTLLEADTLTDTLVPGLVSLLSGMPYLSILSIHSSVVGAVGCSKYKRGYWKDQNLAFIHKVEDVDIEVCSGSNAIEFARYVLEHAENLKRLCINHSPDVSEAIRKLKSSKKVSNARVEISTIGPFSAEEPDVDEVWSLI